jgi:hypothetical protein
VLRFDRPWLSESPADIHKFLKCFFNFILNNKFLALYREKLLNLHKALQNGLVQITCFYWITDFSELRQEPLEAGQSQLGGFEIHQIFFKKILF